MHNRDGYMNRALAQHAGFTLLEVMVALSIVAIGLAAVIQVSASYTSNISYLRDKTLASWVAGNILTEQQVTRSWPEVGSHKGSYSMAGQEWDWRMDVVQTPDSYVRKLSVAVGLSGQDSNLSSIDGYLANHRSP